MTVLNCILKSASKVNRLIRVVSCRPWLKLVLVFGLLGSAFAEPPKTFEEAKKAIKLIYQDHRETFYCQCPYDKHGHVNLKACGFRSITRDRRSQHIEIEHIMPVYDFGRQRACWRTPVCQTKSGKSYRGRQCCAKVDPEFRRMYTDLHNLVPAIGEVNQARSNYRFAELPEVPAGQYGACYIKIDPKARRVEPKAALKGMIARIYLYMASTYKLELSPAQKKLFQAWDKQYPPSAWEKERDRRIQAIQGNRNPFIYKDPNCQVI